MSLTRQGISFLLVGCLLILADWLTFVAMTAAGLSAAPANVLARVVGALLGFWLNGWVTFGDPGSPRHGPRRFIRFAALWGILTVLSTLLITLLANYLSLRVAWLAKPIVEACMAILSFVASRQWVYR